MKSIDAAGALTTSLRSAFFITIRSVAVAAVVLAVESATTPGPTADVDPDPVLPDPGTARAGAWGGNAPVDLLENCSIDGDGVAAAEQPASRSMIIKKQLIPKYLFIFSSNEPNYSN